MSMSFRRCDSTLACLFYPMITPASFFASYNVCLLTKFDVSLPHAIYELLKVFLLLVQILRYFAYFLISLNINGLSSPKFLKLQNLYLTLQFLFIVNPSKLLLKVITKKVSNAYEIYIENGQGKEIFCRTKMSHDGLCLSEILLLFVRF